MRIRAFFRPSVVTFVAGAIISTVVQLVIQASIADNIAILLSLLAFFIVYAIGTSERIAGHTSEALELIKRDIRLTAVWDPNLNEVLDVGYDVSLKRVQEAQESIYVISDYSPEDDEIKHGKERQAYLNAITSVVLEHINNKRDFKYKRIMQRDVMSENLTNGVMTSADMVGDLQTYEHCRDMLDKAHLRGRHTVSLYVRQFIPSMPSILLVDHKYVLFTIPENASRYRGELQSGAHFVNMGALSLHDNTEHGQMVRDFVRMFEAFAQDSKEIESVTP